MKNDSAGNMLEGRSYYDIVQLSKNHSFQQAWDLYTIAFAAFMISDYQYAFEISERFKLLYTDDVSIYDVEILCFGESWDFLRAKEICERYNMKSLSYYIVLSHIELYSWNSVQAKDILLSGLEHHANDPILEYNLWNIFYTLWKYEHALSYYERAIFHGEYLYAYCKKLKVLNILWRKDESRWLIDWLEHKLWSEEIWDADLIYGNIYFEQEKYQEAISRFEAYLKLRPTDFYTHNALANTYYILGKYESAMKHYQVSLEKNPRIPYTYVGIAQCLFKLKKYKDSIAECKKALEYNKNNFSWYFFLARNYYELADYKLALKNFQSAYNLNAEHHMCARYLEKTKQKLWNSQ